MGEDRRKVRPRCRNGGREDCGGVMGKRRDGVVRKHCESRDDDELQDGDGATGQRVGDHE